MPRGGKPSPHFSIRAHPYAFKARYGEGCPTKPPCDGFEAINSSATLCKGFKGQDKGVLMARDHCKKGSKTLGDLEVGLSPEFLSNTPLGEVFQEQAIPLSKDIKGL